LSAFLLKPKAPPTDSGSRIVDVYRQRCRCLFACNHWSASSVARTTNTRASVVSTCSVVTPRYLPPSLSLSLSLSMHGRHVASDRNAASGSRRWQERVPTERSSTSTKPHAADDAVLHSRLFDRGRRHFPIPDAVHEGTARGAPFFPPPSHVPRTTVYVYVLYECIRPPRSLGLSDSDRDGGCQSSVGTRERAARHRAVAARRCPSVCESNRHPSTVIGVVRVAEKDSLSEHASNDGVTVIANHTARRVLVSILMTR